MLKILLIQPPHTLSEGAIKTTILPLGLAYIGAVLRQIPDVNIKILDCAAEGFNNEVKLGRDRFRYGLDDQQIYEIIKTYSPEVVGVSMLFSQQEKNALNVCRLAKQYNPSVRVVVGGHHASFMTYEILSKYSEVDYVVLGEGENTFAEFVRKVLINSNKYDDLDGFAYKDMEQVIINPKRSWIPDLDAIPFPARDLLDLNKYFRINLPQSGRAGRLGRSRSLAVLSSRGCIRNCVYCGTVHLWGNHYRVRSPANFVSELEYLKNKYNLDEFQFQDDSFTLNRKRLISILDLMIDRKLNLSWCAPQGVDVMTLDKEIVNKMKTSGCSELTLAIESGDELVCRKIIGKPIKLAHVREVVKHIKNNRIRVNAFFVIGLPGETKESIRKTLSFANSLDLENASCFIATPLPGTRLYNLVKENDYLLDSFSFDDINYAKGHIRTSEFDPEYLERELFIFRRRQKLMGFLKHPIANGVPYLQISIKSPKTLLKTLVRA